MSYSLPPVALVRETIAILARVAQLAGDKANANALNRADEQVGKGVYGAVQVSADGSLLVPSKESAGTVYRVAGDLPCGCTAGANGRPCWHAALFEAVLVARGEVVTMLDDAAELAGPVVTVAPDPITDDLAYLDLVLSDLRGA